MLPPSYLDQMPDAFVQLWQQVEDEILQDVARRIGKMDAVTPTANWQLWRYQQTEALRNDVVKLLAKYTGKSETAIRKLLLQAATEAMEREDAIYYHYDMEPPPFEESAALNNLLDAGARQTCGTWQNLTATTANTVTGAFERTLDAAWLKVSTGAFDYKTAVKQAVDSLADEMPMVTYPSGHKDSIEVAARRAVLTGVNQTCGKLQEARMDEMGCEFVETTAHGGARPSHAAWQGRRFHRGGAVDYKGKNTTRILKPPPATAPAQAFAAGTAATPFFRGVPGAGRPAPMDTGTAAGAERPEHRVERQKVHRLRDIPDAACPGAERPPLEKAVSGRGRRRAGPHRRRCAPESGPPEPCRVCTGHRWPCGQRPHQRAKVWPERGGSRANWAAKDYEKQQKDAIIIENLRTAAKLPKAAVIHLEPTKINVDALTFDDAHINAEREHRVSEEQAKQYIRNAKISVSVWNGQFERYYGTEGAAYVNTIKHEIRTAYSRAEFDENSTALIEEMKKNGILG